MVKHSDVITSDPREDRQSDVAAVHAFCIRILTRYPMGFLGLSMDILRTILQNEKVEQISFTLTLRPDGKFDLGITKEKEHEEEGATEE